jgi:hypothetical protein
MSDDPIARLSAGPVFVCGMARSGTTWVYDLLTSHPEVGGVSESWMFGNGTGIGERFGPVQGMGLGVLFTPMHWGRRIPIGVGRIMTRGELATDVRRLAGGWLTKSLQPSERYVVEKSPTHVHAIHAIAEVFPEARFVHVLRDGRDVAVSVRAATRSWARGWRRSFGLSVATVAYEWRASILSAGRAQRALGERVREVRYEELRRDPETGLRRLFDFCGFPCDDGLVARAVEANQLGRSEPHGEREFRRAGLVGEWRTRFSPLDAALFEFVAGDALAVTGYETNRYWWLAPRV